MTLYGRCNDVRMLKRCSDVVCQLVTETDFIVDIALISKEIHQPQKLLARIEAEAAKIALRKLNHAFQSRPGSYRQVIK